MMTPSVRSIDTLFNQKTTGIAKAIPIAGPPKDSRKKVLTAAPQEKVP